MLSLIKSQTPPDIVTIKQLTHLVVFWKMSMEKKIKNSFLNIN